MNSETFSKILYVFRCDKMRQFAEISHIELLVSVERYENVVYCGEKSLHLSRNRRYSALKTCLSRKSDFGKSEKNAKSPQQQAFKNKTPIFSRNIIPFSTMS